MVDSSVQFRNIAGVYAYKEDGNLTPEATASAPRALIIGTADKGIGSTAYVVPSTTVAKSVFGTEGTLYKGMWEAKAGGAQELALYRIGAKSAKVTGIGDSAGDFNVGFIVETYRQDADAGTYYSLYYDDAAYRIVVKRNTDDLIIFDNDETAPIDRGEVIVSGYRGTAGGADIGSPSSFVNLVDIIDATYPGTAFEAGEDGLSMSRMEMYEKLYVAYEHVKELDFDVIIPQDVFLDDYNANDQGHYAGSVLPESNAGSDDTYPTAGYFRPGQDVDSLGMVYVEEYEGEYLFWWRFALTGVVANLFPTDPTGASRNMSTMKVDGTILTADDFHEVNFAYQLGRFLYEYSTNIVDATGSIGVLPPSSDSLADKSRWVGKAPTWTLDTVNNVYYIASSADNGNGLLGNKFMAGKDDYRDGFYGGGFIATDTKYMDGEEIVDSNEIPVDLGKYFSVVGDWPLIRNGYSSTSYPASWAGSYGGFYMNMNPSSAPTNKRVFDTRLVFRLGLRQIDDLAGAGYVMLRQKTQGLKVADAPTASLPTSDWRRLSTVRIVKAVIDGVRNAVDSYLGEGMSASTREAMKTSVDKVLLAAKKAGYLRDYKEFEIIQTPAMEIEGKANINLTLVPAFELRQVTLTISLSKSG